MRVAMVLGTFSLYGALTAWGQTVEFDGLDTTVTAPLAVTVDDDTPTVATADGLAVSMAAGGHLLSVDGVPAAAAPRGPSGFFVRDLARGAELTTLQGGLVKGRLGRWTQRVSNTELGLELSATYTPGDGAIDVTATLRDLTGEDRAVVLYYGLPVEGGDILWCDGLRSSPRPPDGAVELGSFQSRGVGATGKHTPYPWSALLAEDCGLAFCYPLDQPRFWRSAYHSGTGTYYLCFDLGLSPATSKFPSQATVSFRLFRFDREWGFRAAAQRYYELYPRLFRKRIAGEGIWMPGTHIATVDRPLDFGFACQQNTDNTSYDDRLGIHSFRRSEPATFWLPLYAQDSRDVEGILRRLRLTCRSQKLLLRRVARSVASSACLTDTGQYDLVGVTAPWCDGALFRFNPDPELPGNPENRAQISYTPRSADRLYRSTAGRVTVQGQDGELLDALGRYGQLNTLNYRRDHFATTDAPLLFNSATRRVGIYQFFSACEFAQYVSADVRRRDKLMFGTSAGDFAPWAAAHFDMLGSEVCWLEHGQ